MSGEPNPGKIKFNKIAVLESAFHVHKAKYYDLPLGNGRAGGCWFGEIHWCFQFQP